MVLNLAEPAEVHHISPSVYSILRVLVIVKLRRPHWNCDEHHDREAVDKKQSVFRLS